MAKKRVRRIGSIRAELVQKSREAALAAIGVYNDPLTKFKSETFIVLMIIAWTYLLHAHCRKKKIDYRYVKKTGKKPTYATTPRGAYKYWSLETCLDHESCPIDKDTINNLKFLVGLRHEIEHQMTLGLDHFLSGRYQACALNFNHYLKTIFGKKAGIDEHMTYSLHFVDMADVPKSADTVVLSVPKKLKQFVEKFDKGLSLDELNHERYSYRLLFTKKLAGRAGTADKVVEFVAADSEAAKGIDKERWVIKEAEKQKYKATDVVAKVKAAGFPKFRLFPYFVDMWKSQDAKKPGKGFGVDVAGYWYWYDTWVVKCIELCAAQGNKFK